MIDSSSTEYRPLQPLLDYRSRLRIHQIDLQRLYRYLLSLTFFYHPFHNHSPLHTILHNTTPHHTGFQNRNVAKAVDSVKQQNLIEKDGKRNALAAVVTAKREVRTRCLPCNIIASFTALFFAIFVLYILRPYYIPTSSLLFHHTPPLLTLPSPSAFPHSLHPPLLRPPTSQLLKHSLEMMVKQELATPQGAASLYERALEVRAVCSITALRCAMRYRITLITPHRLHHICSNIYSVLCHATLFIAALNDDE